MMGWYGSEGWGVGSWIGMGLGMLVFWGLVIFGIIAILRWTSQDRRSGGYVAPPQPGTSTALQILDERFARGELSEDEYRRTRDILQGR